MKLVQSCKIIKLLEMCTTIAAPSIFVKIKLKFISITKYTHIAMITSSDMRTHIQN